MRPAILGLSKHLRFYFLTQKSTITTDYYSKLFKDWVKPAFRSKRRVLSVKSFCLLHENARSNTAALTSGSLEEMHWKLLPHPFYDSDLVSSDFHLFGLLKEDLGGKIFTAEYDVKILCKYCWKNDHKLFWKAHNKAALAMTTVYRRAGRIYRKTGIIFGKRMINNVLWKVRFMFELLSDYRNSVTTNGENMMTSHFTKGYYLWSTQQRQ